MKAMILAAGQGKRLKPYTDDIPKPLITVGEHKLIEHHLYKLAQIGIESVIINVCYKAEMIIQTLGNGSRYNLDIVYSFEEDCLGTGGGISQALPLLKPEPFILISADIWSTFDYNFFITNQGNDKSHMVVVDNFENRPGDFHLQNNMICFIPNQNYLFSGLAIMKPEIFQTEKTGPYDLMTALKPAIEQQQINGHYFDGNWINVGTPEQLLRARSLANQ